MLTPPSELLAAGHERSFASRFRRAPGPSMHLLVNSTIAGQPYHATEYHPGSLAFSLLNADTQQTSHNSPSSGVCVEKRGNKSLRDATRGSTLHCGRSATHPGTPTAATPAI